MKKNAICMVFLLLTLLSSCSVKRSESSASRGGLDGSAVLFEAGGQTCETFSESECNANKECTSYTGEDLRQQIDMYMGCAAKTPTCEPSVGCFRNDKDAREVKRFGLCAPLGWTNFACPGGDASPDPTSCEGLNQSECQVANSCLPYYGTTLDGKSTVFMGCLLKGVPCNGSIGCYRSDENAIEVTTPGLCKVNGWTDFDCP